MRTDERLGTFAEVVADATPEVRDLVVYLRDLVIRLHPETVEVPRPGERSLSYGHGGKKMSEAYVYLMPQRGYVNVGFFQGAGLPDPEGLLEGTGKVLRHVKLRNQAEAARPAVAALIQAAIAERKQALGLA